LLLALLKKKPMLLLLKPANNIVIKPFNISSILEQKIADIPIYYAIDDSNKKN
jgi:hypothetical protein